MSRLTTQLTVTVGGLRGPAGEVDADLTTLEQNVVAKAAQAETAAGQALTAANQISSSSDINIWKDAYFRAVRGEPAAASFASLSLDGAVRAVAASTVLSWDDTSSPFGNPAISVNGSVDLYHYLADGMIRPGQSVSARVGLIVPAGMTVQAQAFLRQGYAGTLVATGTPVSITGDGNYAEVVLPALANAANGTALDVRVTRSSGSGFHKVCAIGAYIGTAARPMLEDVASKYYVRTALALAQAATTQLALVLVPSKNLFDVSRPFSSSIASQNRENVYIIYSSGAIAANTSYNVTHVIELEANTSYARSFAHQAAFFSDSGAAQAQWIGGLQASDGQVFTTPANGSNTKVYARFSVSKAAWAQFQVEKGTAATDWVAYGNVFNPAYLPTANTYIEPTPGSFRCKALREFRQRVLLRDYGGNTRIVHAVISDSYGDNRRRWDGPLHARFIAKKGDSGIAIGDGGGGWTGYADLSANLGTFNHGNIRASYGYSRTGTWTTDTLFYTGGGVDLGAIQSTSAGARVVRTVPAGAPAHTEARLQWSNTADGVIRYTWDGGTTWTTVNVQGATVGDLNSANLSVGMPTTALTAQAQLIIEVVSGTVTLHGDNLDSNQPGYVMHKLAASGSTAAQWAARADTAKWRAGLALLKPNIVTVMLGTNDNNAGASKATFKSYIQRIVDGIRAAVPRADIHLVAVAQTPRVLAVPMSDYARAKYEIARDATNGIAFTWVQDAIGDGSSPSQYASTGIRPWFVDDGSDGSGANDIHPNQVFDNSDVLILESGGLAMMGDIEKSMLFYP